MLDFIGMVTVAALMMLVVNALITFMDVPRVAKITLSRQDGRICPSATGGSINTGNARSPRCWRSRPS